MEVGVKDNFKKKWRRRLKWDGHLERCGDEKITERADAQKLEQNTRLGRPRKR